MHPEPIFADLARTWSWPSPQPRGRHRWRTEPTPPWPIEATDEPDPPTVELLLPREEP